MHRFFAGCAILFVFAIITTYLSLSSYTASDVTTPNTIEYTCPDNSKRSIPCRPGEDMTVYVQPSLVYPFDPVHMTQHNPRLTHVSFLCAGMCALWAYIAYSAALKEGK